MKGRREPKTVPFWPLFRLELVFNSVASPSFVGLVFLYGFWLFLNIAPYFLSQVSGIRELFSPLSPVGPIWFLIAIFMCLDSHIPSLLSRGQTYRPLAFLFTRAIDRAILFRAKSAALAVLLLGPMLIGILVTYWYPSVVVVSRGENAGLVWEQFQEVFPGSTLEAAGLRVPYGNVALALWHLWCGTFVLAAAHAAVSLIAPWGGRLRQSIAQTLIVPPVALIWFGVLWVFVLSPFRGLYDQAFLSFSAHPMVWTLPMLIFIGAVEFYCERRYREIEIL